jgi:hypothetical protein
MVVIVRTILLDIPSYKYVGTTYEFALSINTVIQLKSVNVNGNFNSNSIIVYSMKKYVSYMPARGAA